MFCKTPKPSELSLLRRKRGLSPSWGGGCGTGGRACSGPPRSFPGSLKPMTPGPPDLCGTVARWFSLLSHLFTTIRRSPSRNSTPRSRHALQSQQNSEAPSMPRAHHVLPACFAILADSEHSQQSLRASFLRRHC